MDDPQLTQKIESIRHFVIPLCSCGLVEAWLYPSTCPPILFSYLTDENCLPPFAPDQIYHLCQALHYKNLRNYSKCLILQPFTFCWLITSTFKHKISRKFCEKTDSFFLSRYQPIPLSPFRNYLLYLRFLLPHF